MKNSVLALDIGGSKILAALVQDAQVQHSTTLVTDTNATPEQWLTQAKIATQPWQGQYQQIGIAVTGRVDQQGDWFSLNPQTLSIPDAFPLTTYCQQEWHSPVTAYNDAQAAAWGEYRYGAGQQQDMVFLTISTGIGGGIIANGQLLCGKQGLSGHFGQLRQTATATPLEDGISGRYLAIQARKLGHNMDAKGVFHAAAQGATWAKQLIQQSAQQVAQLCCNIQWMFDPHIIVIGGGIGLADDYLLHIRHYIQQYHALSQPQLRAAALGQYAGVIGVADLILRQT